MDLFREVRARGLLAYRPAREVSALLREVAAGHPVLVLENRGLAVAPLWHYSVLSGYDLEEGTVTLLAGASSAERARLATFRRTWERGGGVGLVALPRGALPAAEDREGILRALAELEEVGEAEAAAEGYKTVLKRWPGSWRAAFGLGNALHSAGDDAGAEEAFRAAREASPGRPEPLNNLALLALARGQREEAESLALAAVERAKALGLPVGLYEETLGEVRGRQAVSR
jgi:tetratricopeptide (TPR) repeat protein